MQKRDVSSRNGRYIIALTYSRADGERSFFDDKKQIQNWTKIIPIIYSSSLVCATTFFKIKKQKHNGPKWIKRSKKQSRR